MTRRAWLHAMPALSATFGLMPWDIERLTFDELDQYRQALERRADSQREQAVKARRRQMG